MSYVSDTTLELVRDRGTVSLDWLLLETIGRSADDTSREVTRAISEIHAALANAGWHWTHRPSEYGLATFYKRPLSDQQPSAENPASGGEGASTQGHSQQTAPEILAAAAQCISDRAATRDLPAERSMARTVRAFNTLTGHTLTEREGWLFMAILKAARATAGSHNPDDYIDGAAYFALAGESAQTTEGKNP